MSVMKVVLTAEYSHQIVRTRFRETAVGAASRGFGKKSPQIL
jgi:hypothetical protein